MLNFSFLRTASSLAIFVAQIAIGSAHAAEDAAALAAPSPRFDIHRYATEGATLLTDAEITSLLTPYTGKSRDFGDVQRALETLQEAYRQRGYGSVEVVLPEQELEQGTVTLHVVEKKLGQITVENNHHYDTDNILRSVPTLKSGDLVNTGAATRSLRVANENPSKQTAILFRNSDANDDAIDATIKVIDEDPSKIFLTLDNTGSRSTGHGRVGIAYQNYNVFNRDHRMFLHFMTAPQFPDNLLSNRNNDVKIFGLGYSIPLYAQGDSLDFMAAYSDVDAAITSDFNLPTKGRVVGARYNHYFDKRPHLEQKISVALDYRASQPGAGFAPSTTFPISLTYAGQWQKDDRQLSFNVGVSKNLWSHWFAHGDDGDLAQESRLAEDDFTRYNWGLDYLQPIARDWKLRLAASGQFTSTRLPAVETFGIGGMDSVRGWHERYFARDKGYRWSVEAISPDFGKTFGDNIGLRGLVFFDKGHGVDVETVGASGAIPNEVNIASIGAGLRFNYAKRFVGRLDYAVVVDGDKGPTSAWDQSREDGDQFMHMSLAWIW